VAFNPISALTGATLAQILTNPETTNLVRNIMQETEALTEKLGVKMQVSIEQRMAGAAKVGEHKTSTLQDLEAGRPLELEAIVGAVLEVGERIGLPMPHTRAVYACTKLLAERRGVASDGGALITSPRMRGEVGLRSNPGEGAGPRVSVKHAPSSRPSPRTREEGVLNHLQESRSAADHHLRRLPADAFGLQSSR